MLKRTLPLIAAISIALAPVAQSENMFSGKAKPNSFWWPDQVDLGPLRDHDNKSSPYGENFDYAKALKDKPEKLKRYHELQAELKKFDSLKPKPLPPGR